MKNHALQNMAFRRFCCTMALAISWCALAHGADRPYVVYRDATSYTEAGRMDGTTENVPTDDRSDHLFVKKSGGYAVYPHIDFSTGVTWKRIAAYGVVGSAYWSDEKFFSVEVRLDGLEGVSLGTITFRDSVLQTLSAPVKAEAVTGVHDVYLVFNGKGVNFGHLYSFQIEGTVGSGTPTTYHVSARSGNDQNDGSEQNPFKTISRAAALMLPGDICRIYEGIYYETLTPANSGTAAAPIRFEAAAGERVVISAADPISGWERHEGGIWRAPMGWDMGPGYNQMYIDTQVVIEARFPNLTLEYDDAVYYDEGRDKSYTRPYYYRNPARHKRDLSHPVLYNTRKGGTPCDGTGDCEQAWLEFNPPTDYGYPRGSQRAYDFPLANHPEDHFVGCTVWKRGYFWVESGLVTASRPTAEGGLHVDCRIAKWRGAEKEAYISGSLALLDVPNEWVYKDGFAYLWAPGNADPRTLYVSAKRRFMTIDLSNRSWIEVKGLYSLGGSLQMEHARNCLVEECHFRYTSHYIYAYESPQHTSVPVSPEDTLHLRTGCDAIKVSGMNNTLRRSSLAFAAGGMLDVAGRNNRVEDCYIHDFGYSRLGSVHLQGKECVVQNCEIFNASRSCVSAGGHIRGAHNQFLYNNIYNSMLMAKDGGTYYLYGLTGWGTELAYNWWHHNYADGAAGHIYLDGGPAAHSIHHNVFWPDNEHVGKRIFVPLSTDIRNGAQIYNNTFVTNTTGKDFQEVLDNFCNDPDRATCANNLNATVDRASWLFADTAAHDYSLSAGSPAIDAGTVVPGFTDGFVGETPDLGAYEFGKPAWKPGITWTYSGWPRLQDIQKNIPSASVAPKAAGVRQNIALLRVIRNRLIMESSDRCRISLSLYNMQGARIAHETHFGKQAALSTDRLASGSYIVKARAGVKQLSRKVQVLR